MKKQDFMKKHGPNSNDKACYGALDWIASLPRNYNSRQIYYACKRSDWMLWYLERTVDNNDPRFRLMACAFVRRTPKGDGKTTWDLLTDERLKNAVIVAEKYATGEATRDDLDRAADAAADAAYASYSARATAYAAYAAADAAYAAYAAADAAYTTARADYTNARAAAYAAYAACACASTTIAATYAAYAVARAAYTTQCDIIREFFPEP